MAKDTKFLIPCVEFAPAMIPHKKRARDTNQLTKLVQAQKLAQCQHTIKSTRGLLHPAIPVLYLPLHSENLIMKCNCIGRYKDAIVRPKETKAAQGTTEKKL
ncbi:hypothetical protein AAZX31_19G167000 [Glycine max]|nr:hypothetical protein GLYMA_19G181550v4 [Glycine max]KAH1078440.1 hypothetical protein GYH30_053443 [Glycine max]